MERYLPEILIERSFAFKTLVIITGAILILVGSLMRSEYPILWIPVFIVGALIEWLIVATVYVEIKAIENKIVEADSEIRTMVGKVNKVQADIEGTQQDIESTKDSAFSFISDSEGKAANSLEERIAEIEEQVGAGWAGGKRGSLERRVSDLEKDVKNISRGKRR